MSYIIFQDIFYIFVLICLSVPLGGYIYKVMAGQRVFLTSVLGPVEKVIYRIMGIKGNEEMGAKKYVFSVLLFSASGFIFLWILQMLQGFLPFNPEDLGGTSWHLAFNTTASFVSNTNWLSDTVFRSYRPEFCFGSNGDCCIVCSYQRIYI